MIVCAKVIQPLFFLQTTGDDQRSQRGPEFYYHGIFECLFSADNFLCHFWKSAQYGLLSKPALRRDHAPPGSLGRAPDGSVR
jgi:hypothetical protein